MRSALCLLIATLLCGSATLLAPSRVCADLQVNQRVDKVVLKDGTEIECIVLMVTAKNVLIVEPDEKDKDKKRQRIIAFEDVDHITYGKSNGSTEGFQTEGELAHKVIQGTGFRREESKKDKDKKAADDKDKKKAPTGNQPLDMSKVKTIATGDKVAAATGKLSAKELSDAYMSRFPVLKGTAQTLIGVDRVPQLIDAAQKGDPMARKQVEGFLGLFLGSDNSSLAEKVEPTATPQKPVKPAKPTRPPPVKKNAPGTGTTGAGLPAK